MARMEEDVVPLGTILTYSDGDAGDAQRLAAAMDLARGTDAHLSVLAVGIEPHLPPSLDGSLPLPMPPSTARQDAERRARAAGESISLAGLRGDAVPAVCQARGFGRALTDAARFADLVVLGRPYGDATPDSAAIAFESALFDGEAPVLIVPDRIQTVSAETVLIAWNGSSEALRAVRGAMPLLVAAQSVRIAIIGALPSEPEPGARLATMLSRHGVTPEILVRVPGEEGTAGTLARCAVETGAGLVVMGAYGHSRLRESLVGGVTREVATKPPVPVLMAH